MAFWFDRITTEKVKKFLSEVNRNPIPTAERSRTVSEAGGYNIGPNIVLDFEKFFAYKIPLIQKLVY